MDQIRGLLGPTRTEMLQMDQPREYLSQWAGTFSAAIDKARIRTRAVGRTLRGVELLELAGVASLEDLDEMEAESNA